MNELVNKDTLTSLELVEQINIFRKEEGAKAELKHKSLLEIIRNEFEEELAEQKILLSEYKDSTGRKLPMYILTLNQAKQVLMRESKFVRKHMIAYIEKLEKQLQNKTQTITEEQRLVLSIYAGGVGAVEATKALVELKTKELNKVIEHKEDVIVGLVDDIELKDKRQILNQVVRYKNANYRKRWQMLYYEFEKKFHVDLQRRLDNYNLNNKPKYKNKLDYIQYNMEKLPQLYEIACKLFEGDIEQIIKEYQELKNN